MSRLVLLENRLHSLHINFQHLLLAVLFGGYLYLVVDTRLIFEARDSLFLWDFRYFTDFLGQPGWLLRWFDALWVQWCHDGGGAAIVIAALAWLLMFSTSGAMDALAGSKVRGTWIIPGISLFYLYDNHSMRTFALVGAAVNMLALWGWSCIRAERPVLRIAVFCICSVTLYYLTGNAFCCFAICCLIYALARQRAWRLTLALAMIGVGAKWAVEVMLPHLGLRTWNFQVPATEANLLNVKTIMFYGYFPLCALFAICLHLRKVSAFLERLKGSSTRNKTVKQKTGKMESSNKTGAVISRNDGVQWFCKTFILLAMAFAFGVFFLDKNRKALLEIDYCADNQQWADLLNNARKLKVYTQYVNHDVNLALYHTGRLPNEMFTFWQHYSILLDQEQVRGDSVGRVSKPCDLLFELGRVNEAEHTALELLENYPTGRTLKRLALIKIIKNDPEAARLFLQVLCKDLVWGRWAEDSLRRLNSGADFSEDEAIRQIRKRMLTQDDLSQVCTITGNGPIMNYYGILADLLKQNPENKMAFEYLMAFYLLDGNLQAVVDLLPYGDRFHYPSLPVSYEEAVLLYASGHPNELRVESSGLHFRNYKISAASGEKFKHLHSILKQSGGSLKNAAPVISRDLKNSYFEYYLIQRRDSHA